MDYIKLITGVVISIIAILLILEREIITIIFGIILMVIGIIIIFNKFENKIEEIKKIKK